MGAHVPLSMILHSWNRKCCPAQVQAWAFTMKITLAISNYNGI